MRTTPLAGWLPIDRRAKDLEGQIYRSIRDRVLADELSAGRPLPSTRALAAFLGVARSTVTAAYDRLQAEGFVEAARGSATRVAALPQPPPTASIAKRSASLQQAPVLDAPADTLFQPGVPDTSEFPHAIWARCLRARARSLRMHDLGYDASAGLIGLRRAVLGHATATRGVTAEVDQVLILPSTSAAIDLMARLRVAGTGRRVRRAWIEEPGYPTARALFREAGARLTAVPCDREGMALANIDAPVPDLIYVTPSHQYPTGVTMSLARRLLLLNMAKQSGAIILEDDYDSEFQYGSKPIAALQAIDSSESVVYLGTFSKVLAPGLRVAYAVVPRRLVSAARAAMRLRGMSVSIHVQAALTDFIEEGHLRAHIRRMRECYGERMAFVADALRNACDRFLEVGETAGGLQLLTYFRDVRVDDTAIADALNRDGIAVRALSDFCLGAPRRGLVLGIAQANPRHAERLVAALAEAARRERRRSSSPHISDATRR